MGPTRAELSVNGWNADFIEELYGQWRADPESVEEQWRQFFMGFELGARQLDETGGTVSTDGRQRVAHTSQGRVDSLIYHYRDIGHFAADLDPLGTQRPFPESLTLESFGLSDSELQERFDPGSLPLDSDTKLADIINLLEDTYCGHIGAEYMHIQSRQHRQWLQKRMETVRNRPPVTPDQKRRILRNLIEADGFESFLAKRYMGKKRFGLDGAESLIPLLDEIVELGPVNNVKEFTIGMAHRGRLNVLVNILNKTYDQIFTEFEEAWTEDFLDGGGDVKYHRGYSADFETESGHNVRLTLSPNPSHLEFVNSVVLGRARSKQRIRKDVEREQCLPLLIHGDAAFPGQGIVAECLNMMKLDGYTVGGAIHVVVNNQIGFTTNPSDTRSGSYCTDIAKMVDAPIFHVNGHDAEACAWVGKMALEYRQAFKNDVVIDLWCYRKHGHNEGDEPTYTQPLMYDRIKEQRPVLQHYVDQLTSEGVITKDQFDAQYNQQREALDSAQTRSKESPVDPMINPFKNVWSGLTGDYSRDAVDTSVKKDHLTEVSQAFAAMPEDFSLHRKLKKLVEYRSTAVDTNESLDWAMGELLAYGTLLVEGHAVRLTGQDVERGTFSHRHAIYFDQETGQGFDPLNHIVEGQAKFCVHNSPLTESACVGFEYGYSLGDPNMLVIWEAQFGDFANGAQVIFDQFVASAAVKWERFSGLTLFLPHGYEGQGPEHSSARLERFLALCARNNLQVVYPTTPAQMFHMLRRQMKQQFRIPLVVMTPKSLLRHPKAISNIDDLTNSAFQRVIDDAEVKDARKIDRLVLCSGKIYYDLIEQRERAKSDDVAVVRVEELYPFPAQELKAIFDKYAGVEDICWVQEEPANMGAWRHMWFMLDKHFDVSPHYIGRDENASPAVASMKMHEQEQSKIVIEAVGLTEEHSEETQSETAHKPATKKTSRKKKSTSSNRKSKRNVRAAG